MPVVPIEENKVGIASLTDAKLSPGNFSGSGLDALGSGLQQVGGAGEELGKALGTKSPAPATPKPSPKAEEGNQRDVKADMVGRSVKTLAVQTPKQVSDDAAVKAACNRYFEAVRPSLDPGNEAMSANQGGRAVPAVAHVIQARDDAAADLTPEQHAAYHTAIARRVDQDLNLVQGLDDARTKVARQVESQRVVTNCAQDAILQYGSPAFGEHMATCLKQIDEQAAAGGWTPEAKSAAETALISGVHRGVSDSLSASDPVAAADHLRAFGDHMTPEDRAAAWQSLNGPLAQTQAVADLDTLTIARSATAPLTPHGDHDQLMRRMLAITPAMPAENNKGAAGANVPTDLPEMLDRYGGDAAKAWAASEMGADAFDALVAKHGATWFGALPAETRNAVAANMAMLGAVASPRGAPADGGALAMEIEDQPWSEERKRNAFDELNTRIGLDARRVKQAQDDAKEGGLALADHLGPGFISINQLPPAMRANLGADALAALTLRADRNVHPVKVAAHGDMAMGLNRMAASDPEAFAKEDLRLHRDEMTAAEYDALDRVQKAWSGYPPGPAAITQQRSIEKAHRSGLDIFSGEAGAGDARATSARSEGDGKASRGGLGSTQARFIPVAMPQDGGLLAQDRGIALDLAKRNGGDPVQILRALRGQPPLPEAKAPPPPRVQTTRAKANPYSSENLDLGPNAKYADVINAAGRQSGFPPQAIAALIGAEAAAGAKGWDPMSYNSKTGASGLAQFKSDTWLGEAARAGSYLNVRARSLGFLDKRGKILPAHQQELLKLRFNPSDAIFTAADHAQYNIQNLRENNLLVDNSATALAKYAYIMHHDGRKGGKLFLRGDNHSATAFSQGLSPAQRAKYLKANNNNVDQAYRAFFNDVIDSKIDISKYMRDSRGVTVPSTLSLYTLSKPMGQ
jgi:hypothetical protein